MYEGDIASVLITEEQITEESVLIIKLLLSIYKDFGFEDVAVKFADRPPKRVGSDEIWDKSEKALKAAAAAAGIECDYNPGEGAFYGRFVAVAQLVAKLLELLLGLENERVSVVHFLDALGFGFVGFGVGSGFLAHALDVLLA